MQRDAALIRIARKAKNWTQANLAAAMRKGNSTVFRIESGDETVGVDLWMKAAELVGLTYDPSARGVIQPPDVSDARIELELSEMKAGREKRGRKDKAGRSPSQGTSNAVPVVAAQLAALIASGEAEELVDALAVALSGRFAVGPARAQEASDRVRAIDPPFVPGDQDDGRPPDEVPRKYPKK